MSRHHRRTRYERDTNAIRTRRKRERENVRTYFDRASCARQAVAVNQTVVQKFLHHNGNTAQLIEVGHLILSLHSRPTSVMRFVSDFAMNNERDSQMRKRTYVRRQVGKKRNRLADSIKILNV